MRVDCCDKDRPLPCGGHQPGLLGVGAPRLELIGSGLGEPVSLPNSTVRGEPPSAMCVLLIPFRRVQDVASRCHGWSLPPQCEPCVNQALRKVTSRLRTCYDGGDRVSEPSQCRRRDDKQRMHTAFSSASHTRLTRASQTFCASLRQGGHDDHTAHAHTTPDSQRFLARGTRGGTPAQGRGRRKGRPCAREPRRTSTRPASRTTATL